MAMATRFRETIFMLYLGGFIFPDRDVGCTTVKKDNQGAIHWAKKNVNTPNGKHVDVRRHFFSSEACC